jgi:hypothetical protein
MLLGSWSGCGRGASSYSAAGRARAICIDAMCCGGSQVEEQLELARMEVRQNPGWCTESELLSMGVIV